MLYDETDRRPCELRQCEAAATAGVGRCLPGESARAAASRAVISHGGFTPIAGTYVGEGTLNAWHFVNAQVKNSSPMPRMKVGAWYCHPR